MTDAKHDMKPLKLKDVEANFEQVLDDVLGSCTPVEITSSAGNAVLVSEEEFKN